MICRSNDAWGSGGGGARSCTRRVVVALFAVACQLAPLGAATQAGATKQTKQTEQTEQPKQPNVLLILVDDLRPELAAFGARHGAMPCLDAFNEKATVLTRHFVQVPTCGASRYAFLTGRSPKASRALGNEAFFRGPTAIPKVTEPAASESRPRPAWTMPELFRQNGYRTVQIGKVSHTPDGKVYAYDGSGDGRAELPGAWDEVTTPYGPWKRGWGAFFAYPGGSHREDGEGHRDLMDFSAEQDSELPDGLLAARAVDVLAGFAKSKERFFLAVGFYKPHLPFVATRGDLRAIEALEQVDDSPEPSPTASSYFHASREFFGYKNAFEKDRPLVAADRLDARRAYLACARFVDRQIGKLLAALKDGGLDENTIVVVWSDHGWHLGDSGIWGKHSPFERALHSPLLLKLPKKLLPKAPQRIDHLVASIDLYPTLIEACALERRATAHTLDGLSLMPLLSGVEKPLWRQAVLSYWKDIVTVRSDTHRWIARRGEGAAFVGVELYDLREGLDPGARLPSVDAERAARLAAFARE